MTDSERLDWLESRCTLNSGIEFEYLHGGYEAICVIDGDASFSTNGATLRKSIDQLAEWAEDLRRIRNKGE